MYNLFPKKPLPKKPGRRAATPADEHFFPMAIGFLMFSLLLAGTMRQPPAPRVGDEFFFGGTAQLRSGGAAPVDAAAVRDIWGDGAAPCRLDLRAMARAGGSMAIEAVSPSQVILQWHAPAGAGPIGCPASPALLAVSQDDYQRMQKWRQAAAHSYFRG